MNRSKLNQLLVLMVMMVLAGQVHAQNLFGDPPCADWPEIQSASKLAWLNAFLAPLNMATLTRKKTLEDKFSKLPSLSPALLSVDAFCVVHPGRHASEGAVVFLDELNAAP